MGALQMWRAWRWLCSGVPGSYISCPCIRAVWRAADSTNLTCYDCPVHSGSPAEVSNAATDATYTCTSAADSRVSACAAGFFKTAGATGAGDICTAYTPVANARVGAGACAYTATVLAIPRRCSNLNAGEYADVTLSPCTPGSVNHVVQDAGVLSSHSAESTYGINQDCILHIETSPGTLTSFLVCHEHNLRAVNCFCRYCCPA